MDLRKKIKVRLSAIISPSSWGGIQVENIIAKDYRIVVRFVVTGALLGDFQSIPATGNQTEVSSILMWSIKNSKIVEEREEADGLAMMQQLGMELKPKEGE